MTELNNFVKYFPEQTLYNANKGDDIFEINKKLLEFVLFLHKLPNDYILTVPIVNYDEEIQISSVMEQNQLIVNFEYIKNIINEKLDNIINIYIKSVEQKQNDILQNISNIDLMKSISLKYKK